MDDELLRAVEENDLSRARNLLAAGVNPDDDGWGLPLIDEAIARKDADMTRLLMEHGADLEATDAHGRTRLHRAAAAADDRDAVGFLLGLGLDINSRDDAGWTPCRYAIAYGHSEVAALLLGRGALREASDEPADRPGESGATDHT